MAEFFSQTEIDELINSGIANDKHSGDGIQQQAASSSSTQTQKNKLFKSPQKETFRFKTTYRSPVLKQEDIILDPDPEYSEENGKVIVRSLENFEKFVLCKRNNLKNG